MMSVMVQVHEMEHAIQQKNVPILEEHMQDHAQKDMEFAV